MKVLKVVKKVKKADSELLSEKSFGSFGHGVQVQIREWKGEVYPNFDIASSFLSGRREDALSTLKELKLRASQLEQAIKWADAEVKKHI